MKKINKIIGLTLAGMLAFSVANAQIIEQSMNNNFSMMHSENINGKITKKNVNLKISTKYPLVLLRNQKAQDKINDVLRQYVNSMSEFRRGIDDDTAVVPSEIAISYEVKRDDNKYVSIVMTYYTYCEGAAHGNYKVETFTFNAKNGELLPFSHFVKMKPNDIAFEIHEHLYDASDQPYDCKGYVMDESLPTEITRYYIDKDNNIYMLFDPYEMAPYAAGVTYVKLTPAQQKNYNNNGPRG